MTENTTTDEKDVSVYELGYHILPTTPAEEVEAEVAKLRSAIETRGGSFITEGTPESVALSYPMFVNNGGKQTKYDRAYFGWLKFEMDPAQAATLQEEELQKNAQVLRASVTKTVREETRAQMQVAEAGVLREVHTTGTIEKKQTDISEEKGEVSEEQIDKSIDDLVGDEEKKDEN